MESDGKVMESAIDVAFLKFKIKEDSRPDHPSSPSAGGSVSTVGNDRDNSSKDGVQGPDNLSSRITRLREEIQKDLAKFKSTLAWRAEELGKMVSTTIEESQDPKRRAPLDTLKDNLWKAELEILKLPLLALHNLLEAKSSTLGLPKVVEDEISGQKLAKLQAEFKMTPASPTIQGVRQLYDRLNENRKKCLLCLTAFPENAIIKKRILINWWVGEKFLDVRDLKQPMDIEKAAGEIFEELGEKGFIMLVHKKRKQRCPVPDSCQLHPFMRRVLITLATDDDFLDFDTRGNATPKYSECSRACLVEGGQLLRPSSVSRGGRLQTLFNMNEQFLNLKLDSFSRCRVLQLGRWVVSPDHSIDVDDAPSLLKGMGTMKSLRYLSLQGVTKIGTLPASICKLSNLTILDLGACQSLETLPREIGFLGELTYLDFSECYLISHMPKSLKNLEKLQVLKGFVLYHSVHQNESKNTCTLSDLAAMKNLWKLSLRMDKAADLEDAHIEDLSKLPELRSLTITWIGAPGKLKQPEKSKRGSDNPRQPNTPVKLDKLTKLDLRGYPAPSMPKWLTPEKVKNINKLYIRGGKLANLNQKTPNEYQWRVKILRLKFLAKGAFGNDSVPGS